MCIFNTFIYFFFSLRYMALFIYMFQSFSLFIQLRCTHNKHTEYTYNTIRLCLLPSPLPSVCGGFSWGACESQCTWNVIQPKNTTRLLSNSQHLSFIFILIIEFFSWNTYIFDTSTVRRFHMTFLNWQSVFVYRRISVVDKFENRNDRINEHKKKKRNVSALQSS